MKRVGTWLAVRTGSYQSAVEGLAENLRVEVSKTSLWRVVQEKGAVVKSRLDAEAQEQWGLPPQGQVVTGEVKQKTPMGIAVDGVYINLVEEGWKEVKVGAVFEVVPLSPTKQGGERRRQEQTEGRERVKAQAISYCATLGSVDEFEPVQWAEACRRQLPRCWDSVVLGDGAEWIDRIHQTCYPDAVRVVDWYHACDLNFAQNS